ncbi:MAG: hypothetical protein CMM01_26680 [Rhodopirellula sp.]|nr:hypothetical protein [Rhodopirellula sp.]
MRAAVHSLIDLFSLPVTVHWAILQKSTEMTVKAVAVTETTAEICAQHLYQGCSATPRFVTSVGVGIIPIIPIIRNFIAFFSPPPLKHLPELPAKSASGVFLLFLLEILMKSVCTVALLLLLATVCRAEDTASFGLAGLQPVTDAEVLEVRGAGIDTALTMMATSSMAFSIVDVDSGSVFNMNATSQMTGKDTAIGDMDTSRGFQSLGLSNTGGVQFGTADLTLNEFSFSIDGFSSIGQANQIGGAATGLNFTALLP